MLSYFIIGATIIIQFIGLILLARTLGTDYKYKELDDNYEPLVIHGQGDYRKVIRPSDLPNHGYAPDWEGDDPRLNGD